MVYVLWFYLVIDSGCTRSKLLAIPPTTKNDELSAERQEILGTLIEALVLSEFCLHSCLPCISLVYHVSQSFGDSHAFFNLLYLF